MFSGCPSTYISTANDPTLTSVLSNPQSCRLPSHPNIVMQPSADNRKFDEPPLYHPSLHPHFGVVSSAASSGITPSFSALKSSLGYNSTLSSNSPPSQMSTSSSYYHAPPLCGDMVMNIQPPALTSQSYIPMDYVQQTPRRSNLVRQSGCNQETVHTQSDSPMTGVQMQQSPVLSS